MHSVFTKTLYDKRWFMLGWSAAFGFMSLLVIVFYPSFSDTFQFDQLANQLPAAFQGLIGDVANLKTLSGYIAEQLFNIRIPLFMLIMTIVLGLGLSISDEEFGRTRTLLMAPTSRTELLFHKLAAAIIIVGLISLATVLFLYLGIVIIHESPPNTLIWELFGLSWIFGSTAVTIVICLGHALGQRAPTTGIALLITIGSFILTTFGSAVDWLKPYERASLLHYYDATGLTKHDFSSSHLWVLLAIGVVAVSVALVRFRTRDLQ